jgi:hypothetical protein
MTVSRERSVLASHSFRPRSGIHIDSHALPKSRNKFVGRTTHCTHSVIIRAEWPTPARNQPI